MVARRHHHQHHHKRYFARAAADCCCFDVWSPVLHSINELCFPLSKLDWRFDVGWFLYCCFCCWRCFSFLPFVLSLICFIAISNRTTAHAHYIVACYYWKQHLIGVICFCFEFTAWRTRTRAQSYLQRIFNAPKWTQTFIDCSENRAEAQNRAIYSM